VQEFRKGIRIGAVRREFQLKVVDCPKNFAPEALYRLPTKNTFYKAGEVLTIKRGQEKCLEVLITDRDPNQRLTVRTVGVNFDDKSVNINPATYTTASTKDTLKTRLCFDPCVESQNNQPVIIEVIVSDDGCPQPLIDTLRIRVFIEGSANNKPIVLTDLANNRAGIAQGSILNFKVTGTDKDNDNLILEGKGRGFQLNQVGMTFNNATGKGTITQPFTWNPPCTALDKEYVVDFILTDIGCNRQVKDTVTVRLQATAKPNSKPKVSTSLANTQPLAVPLPSIDANSAVSFDVYADDADKTDQLRLYAQGKGFTLSQYQMKFDEKTGISRLTSRFEWRSSCAQYAELEGKEVVVSFMTEDNSCAPNKTDSLAVRLRVGNLPLASNVEQNIPNIITPNNDGKNDCFFIDGISSVACGPQFEKAEIFNRWGKMIFSTTDTQFKWCGEGVPAGQYFYGLRFTNQTIKGTLTVIR